MATYVGIDVGTFGLEIAIDAKSLQRFGQQQTPSPTPPPDPAQRALRDLSRTRYEALLARGKTTKQARTALARWLLTILNVMVRDGLRWEQTRAAGGGALA